MKKPTRLEVVVIISAGVVACAALTTMLLRASANRKGDKLVERFRAHGAM